MPEKLLCSRARGAPCVSIWLGERASAFTKLIAIASKLSRDLINKIFKLKCVSIERAIRASRLSTYNILFAPQSNHNPRFVQSWSEKFEKFLNHWFRKFFVSRCDHVALQPSANRPEGRAARGKPGNVWPKIFIGLGNLPVS